MSMVIFCVIFFFLQFHLWSNSIYNCFNINMKYVWLITKRWNSTPLNTSDFVIYLHLIRVIVVMLSLKFERIPFSKNLSFWSINSNLLGFSNTYWWRIDLIGKNAENFFTQERILDKAKGWLIVFKRNHFKDRHQTHILPSHARFCKFIVHPKHHSLLVNLKRYDFTKKMSTRAMRALIFRNFTLLTVWKM